MRNWPQMMKAGATTAITMVCGFCPVMEIHAKVMENNCKVTEFL